MKRLLLLIPALILLGLLGAYLPPSAVAAEYSPPSTVPADCSADAQPGLAAWIATVPDHSVLVFPSGACYLLVRELRIEGRTGLDIEGAGATLRSGVAVPGCGPGDPVAHVLTLANTTDVRISGLRLEGTNPIPGKYNGTSYCQHGVRLLDATNTVLTSLTVRNPWGDCMLATSNGPAGLGSFETFVYGMDCAGAGREGSGLTYGAGIYVIGSRFVNIGHLGFSADSPRAADHIDFIGNTVQAKLGTFNVSMRLDETVGVRVINNYCLIGVDPTKTSCRIDIGGDGGVRDVVVAGNTQQGPHMNPVGLVTVSKAWSVTVTGNTFSCPSSVTWLRITNTQSLAATNNVATGCKDVTITAAPPSTGLVFYNNVR